MPPVPLEARAIWLSARGFIAILLNLAAGLLASSGLISPLSEIGSVLQLPIFLQEIVLAVWLIAKGFDPAKGAQ